MCSIENLIKESLETIIKLLKCGDSCDCKVVFPNDKKDKKRYSEQELKCIFLEKLCNEQDISYSYSTETPTKNVYRFANKTPLVSKELGIEGYRSANVDVSIYENNTILNHIEFKFGQPDIFPIRKDLLKLICENNSGDSFFVHYWVTDSYEKGTQDRLLKKFNDAVNDILNNSGDNEFVIQRFKKRKNNVKVFLVFIVLNPINVYRYSFSLADAEKEIFHECDEFVE